MNQIWIWHLTKYIQGIHKHINGTMRIYVSYMGWTSWNRIQSRHLNKPLSANCHSLLDSLITFFNERRGRGECHPNWSIQAQHFVHLFDYDIVNITYTKNIFMAQWLYETMSAKCVWLPEIASNHDISIKLLLLRTVANIANYKMLDSLINPFNESGGRGECHPNWSIRVNLLRRICPCCHHLILGGCLPPPGVGEWFVPVNMKT